MTTLSNTYIEKVNSEHPLAVWMLNEQVDYLSSISEEERRIYDGAHWAITNGSSSNETSPPANTPFLTSATSRLSGDVPSGLFMDLEARSIFEVPTDNFTEELANFAISFFLYVDNPYTESISFGYEYYDPIGLATVEVLDTRTISSLDAGSWLFFSYTYPLPPAGVTDVKFLFRLNVATGGGINDYDFLINGLTVGQWSEEFNKTSLGVTPIPLPSNIALPTDPTAGTPTCTPALPYGASTLNGYYLSHDYRLYANNFGIPLVFGSSNVTKIYTHTHGDVTYPALIFPGYGFLNERGKFNEYTAEMWIRINTDAVTPRKLFGPITGNDGLYVEGGFLTFVIGNNYGSYYVGEWFRPMIIHIRYIKDNVTVLVNGEQVINIDLLESELELPNEYNESGDSQDWLGFYAYNDITPIDIDSFALYSYAVPVEVAKRRWVWGQGVVAPETTNSALNATTAFNDYSFANYAVNYNYPDFASWRQAFFSNVETSSNFLKLPDYNLPTLFIEDNITENEWLSDLQATQTSTADKYYTFRPDSSYDDKTCYMYLPQFGVLNDPIESFYGVFQTNGSASNEIIFKINNKLSGDYLSCSINGTTLSYSVSLSGTITSLGTKTITANQNFIAGINLPQLSLRNINGINKFFADESTLNIYIGGDSASTFRGRMYTAGFDASYNNRKIANLYDSSGLFKVSDSANITNVYQQEGSELITFTANNTFYVGEIVTISGITDPLLTQYNLSNKEIQDCTATAFTIKDVAIPINPSADDTINSTCSGTASVSQSNRATTLKNHVGNYTLKMYEKYGIFFRDIAVAAYWADYMPLSYFGKYVENYDGEKFYDLDSIQINLDYPEPLEVNAVESTSSWTYGDLKSRYQNPVQLTYEDLANNFFTGWEDYEDMSQDSEKYYYYSTDKNAVRSYVSFQRILDGANTNLVDFAHKAVPRVRGVVDPNSLVEVDQNGNASPGTWEDTAYEVVDGTIIYPPQTDNQENAVDFNDLALVYHLEFSSEGINHHPISFRELQLASQVLERKQFTEIGTRFGVPVYPYSKTGLYFDFKGQNPISIYKGSTPYLYLNRHSGWRIRGGFSPILDRGISIPINVQQGLGTEISALQMWIRFSDIYFPNEEIVIFSVDHKDGIYDFYVKSDESTQRGYIYAKNRATDAIVETVEYHVNGKPVDTAYIINEEWSVLGVAFTELLSFDQYTGRLNLNGPLTYNNVSYYLATNLEQNQRIEVRSWGEVKNDGTARTWDYWENFSTWGEVKVISTINVYSIDPGAIYEKYVGTNRIVIDDNIDGVLVNPDSLKVYSDVGWTSSTQIAV
jgi:hypothetical protein